MEFLPRSRPSGHRLHRDFTTASHKLWAMGQQLRRNCKSPALANRFAGCVQAVIRKGADRPSSSFTLGQFVEQERSDDRDRQQLAGPSRIRVDAVKGGRSERGVGQAATQGPPRNAATELQLPVAVSACGRVRERSGRRLV